VRQALVEQQEKRQIDTVNSLSGRISSDIDSIVMRMRLFVTEPEIQKADFTSDATTLLLKQGFQDLSKIAQVEGFGIIDNNNKVVNTAVDDQRQFIGADVSDRDYLKGVRAHGQPYVSESYIGLNGKRAFAIAVPILNRESSQNMGTLSARFVVPEFFKPYQDYLQSSFIIAFDRSQVYISTTVPEFLGEYFWGEHVQSAIGRSEPLNNAYRSLFSGKPVSTLFISGVTHDERFVAGAPVFYEGEQVMSLAVTIPTAAIYAQVNDILLAQKIEIIVALAAVVGAISILILYLSRWNKALDNKVKQRTLELEGARDRLEMANLRLQEHDKMQKEFINIAAHELRTPIQPILGIAEMMNMSLDSKDKIEVSREEVKMIMRNAERLEQLSSDILVLSRIESGNMQLNREQVDLAEKIERIVVDLQTSVANKNVNLTFEYNTAQLPQSSTDSNEGSKEIMVDADRTKLFEVLSNLIRNAVKFTDEGTITVSLAKSEDNRFAIVSIRDTGRGIDQEIMPRLFEKFATKSESGTGIGLFIARAIVEAHGGTIWGANNKDGKGATFTFTLPLSDHIQSKENSDSHNISSH